MVAAESASTLRMAPAPLSEETAARDTVKFPALLPGQTYPAKTLIKTADSSVTVTGAEPEAKPVTVTESKSAKEAVRESTGNLAEQVTEHAAGQITARAKNVA